jgi:glutamate racemase
VVTRAPLRDTRKNTQLPDTHSRKAIPLTREFDGYIGMFDSGVGGVSVLQAAAARLPHEKFLYYGDSANAPYGEKSRAWIRDRSDAIVSNMLALGVKAVVIACNTATSAAAQMLRDEHPNVPIIGVEPALKPAALSANTSNILVMATRVTLRLEKFQKLYRTWGVKRTVYPVPCPGLADRIEKGNLDAPDMYDLLEKLVGPYRGKADSVVLGCTHYPFVKEQIARVVGDVEMFDSGEGTARQLARRIDELGISAPASQMGSIVFRSSRNTPDELDLYRTFFDMKIS